MVRNILRILGTVVSLAIGTVQAAPMTPDPTGMWYDPANPGWGLSVTEQGETLFVALFIYDANHKPAWYVASNVVDSGCTSIPSAPRSSPAHSIARQDPGSATRRSTRTRSPSRKWGT